MRRVLSTPRQLGEILAHRRKALGLTQVEVARKLGVAQGRVSVLETDPKTLSVERLLALASLLGLEIAIEIRESSSTSSPSTEW